MSAKTAILFLSLSLTITPCLAQQNAVASGQQAQPAKGPTSDEDVRTLRADLARMKALVQQMEVNLAFATPAETPLRHQFELEIAAWKIVIQDMERRLSHTGAH